jgi:hypothetical protein
MKSAIRSCSAINAALVIFGWCSSSLAKGYDREREHETPMPFTFLL